MIDVIECDSLRKVFGGGSLAVENASLTVSAGTTCGLVGPNGSGKTTTLRCIMGLLRATSGVVRVGGRKVVAGDVWLRQATGFVSSERRFYRWMTVAENISFTKSFFPGWDDVWHKNLLRRVDLVTRKRVSDLSSGEQEKLEIVLALSHRPRILILDEPTTNLDPIVREQIVELLKDIRARHDTTTLLSSHIIEDIERLADCVVIMHCGRTFAAVSTDRVIKEAILVSGRAAAVSKPWFPQDAAAISCFDEGGGVSFEVLLDHRNDSVIAELQQRNSAPHTTSRPVSMTEYIRRRLFWLEGRCGH